MKLKTVIGSGVPETILTNASSFLPLSLSLQPKKWVLNYLALIGFLLLIWAPSQICCYSCLLCGIAPALLAIKRPSLEVHLLIANFADKFLVTSFNFFKVLRIERKLRMLRKLVWGRNITVCSSSSKQYWTSARFKISSWFIKR